MKDGHGFNKALKALADDIFACFLELDYENNQYLYEHRIHNSKFRFTSYLLKHANSKQATNMLATYNALIDAGLLRWRVKDKSAFAICGKEMADIKNALFDGIELSKQIAAFESIYESVLQVTAKEPLPFLLFIQSLKKLEESILAITHTASA